MTGEQEKGRAATFYLTSLVLARDLAKTRLHESHS